MIRELTLSVLSLAFMICLLFGMALLTGCAPAKFIADCTFVQPDNCN
jgi:hypothetical protein